MAQTSAQPPADAVAYPGAGSAPLSHDVLNVFLFLLQLFGRD